MVRNMNKKIILLANDRPGIEVCKYLIDHGETILRLYIHDPEEQKYANEIISNSRLDQRNIFLAGTLKDPDHIKEISNIHFDYIISVYWAHLLPKSLLDSAREGTVNFHPALLPINRGWYPHVHSIIDGSPLGVTLHAMDESADTGPIWAQKEVSLSPYDTAGSIYDKLQGEIVALFIETWPKILDKSIIPIPQDNSRAVYHKKKEVDALDKVNLESSMKVREIINLLRARSFGTMGFAFYEVDGEKVYVNIKLGKSNNFRNKD